MAFKQALPVYIPEEQPKPKIQTNKKRKETNKNRIKKYN